jgi:DNA-binding MarR family transcriptional regulator
MAAEAARIARLEKVVRDLDPQKVLAHVDKDIAEQVVKETSDEGKRRRIILSLIKRQKQPSSSLDKILSVLEGNLVISRLQDHCASIPTPKVIEHLMKESLATTDEKEKIENFTTAAGRGGKLLDYLERLLEGNETGRVMKVLYAALVKCKAFHLAKLVFPEEPLDVDDPRKLEPMTEDHKGLLNRKRIDLNGIDVKKVIPHLQAMEQLDGYDADTITTERTSVGQTSKLIDTLRTKSDFAFHAFMCALYENGYQHLVTLLDSTFRIVKEDQSQFTRATNAAKDARTDGRVRPEGKLIICRVSFLAEFKYSYCKSHLLWYADNYSDK